MDPKTLAEAKALSRDAFKQATEKFLARKTGGHFIHCHILDGGPWCTCGHFAQLRKCAEEAA